MDFFDVAEAAIDHGGHAGVLQGGGLFVHELGEFGQIGDDADALAAEQAALGTGGRELTGELGVFRDGGCAVIQLELGEADGSVELADGGVESVTALGQVVESAQLQVELVGSDLQRRDRAEFGLAVGDLAVELGELAAPSVDGSLAAPVQAGTEHQQEHQRSDHDVVDHVWSHSLKASVG